MTLTDDATPTSWLELPDAPAIPGLRFRRLRRDDADYDELAAVVRASNGADDIPFAPTGANLREDFEGHDAFDPGVDHILAEVDGVIVADAGADRVQRGETIVYEIWGNVDPAWRRRGLGRTLLAANLRRSRERADVGAATDDRPVFAGGFVEAGQLGYQRILADAGFETARYFFDMIADLDGVEATALPEGLEVRPLTPDQHRAVWDADHEAFLDHWQARQPDASDFVTLFAKADFDPALWVVAWDGDEVAGSVQPWIYPDENEALGVRRGWLEHISVRRPYRGRGLARALSTEAMRRLRERGMTEAALGVDAANPTGALGLYESMGFRVTSRFTASRLRLR